MDCKLIMLIIWASHPMPDGFGFFVACVVVVVAG